MFKILENKLKQEYGDSVGIHHCSSKGTSVHTKIGNEADCVDIVVVIHDILRIAMVWNIKARRTEKCTAKTLTYSKKWEEFICTNKEIVPHYKTFKANGGEFYEKVIVLETDTLFEVATRLPELLDFDCKDDGYPFTCDANCSNENKIRTKCTISRWNRDQKFRQGVLNKYGFRCVICRCDIPQMLDAAHERGFEVYKTDKDMVNHGICLCRNHHAMYDKTLDNDPTTHLIDIDLKNCTIKINDDRIKQMPWYKEFCEQYKGRILDPISE